MKKNSIVSAIWILICVVLFIGLPLHGQVSSGTAVSSIMQAGYDPPPIDNDWQPFSIQLSAKNFNVSPAVFDSILANVHTFRIRTEMSDAKDTGCLDSVRVGTRYVSAFSDGSEGWSASGDGTMEWKSFGGVTGGYLQISDWSTSDWHWAVAPPSWAGDWSGLKDSFITFFFKTDHPDYAALIEIGSAESTQLFLSANPMTIPLGTTGLARLSLPAATITDVIVSLSSSESGCLQVPEAVTIRKGTTDVEFSVYMTSSSTTGCSSVITAAAEGYETSRMTMYVGKTADASKYATLEGRVTDAMTKAGIPGVVVWVAGKSAQTDSLGHYLIENIPTSIIAANFSAEPRSGKVPLPVRFNDLSSVGRYALSASASGYMGTESLLSFDEGESKYIEISLTPIIKPGEMRLILNWGGQPKDLDLHLRTPVIDGLAHEIYWKNTGSLASAPYVFLDVDHQEGYGPETITIGALKPGTYRCYVDNYSTIPDINNAKAQVQIYTSSGLLQTVVIPTSGAGAYWYVCDIDGATGAVTVRNIIQSGSPGMMLAAIRAKNPAAHQIISSGGIISWSWDFDNDLFVDSYTQNPEYIYSKPGVYTVTLKVSDGSREYQVKKENYITALPAVITDVSWSRQYSSAIEDLYTVFAVDSMRAWAGGAGGILLATFDGGTTWNSRYVASQFTLRDLHFVSPELGWAVGNDSKQNSLILKTVDGGVSWSRVLSSSSSRLYSLDMVDASAGWSAGYEGKVEHTANGGATWSQQFTGLTASLRAIFFLDAEKGIAVGDNGVVLRTSDGGLTWQLMTSGTSSQINDLWFSDENLGWAVTEDGKVLMSVNGGSTWSSQQISTSPLRAIHFDNSYHGYAAGADGKIFKTYNSGDTWSIDITGTSNDLNDLFLVNPTCAWAVGEGGTILRLRQGVTYPGSVTSLFAWATGPNSISLKWENPGGDFAGTVIIRKKDAYPASATDGTKIYEGTAASASDSPLAENSTYYYSAFAYDSAGRYALLGSTSRAMAKTEEGFNLFGYRVTVSSIDASAFPLVKSFVSVVDSTTLEPIAGLTSANFTAREDGVSESPISVEAVSITSGAKADIVFVFDTTGSMGGYISGLKERATAFADVLAAKGIDYRLALVTYGDAVDKVNDFTEDIATFKGWIGGLYASGGGDTKENSLEGLAKATTLGFRPVSQRIVILITDADYHQAGESGGGTTAYTTATMIALLKEQRVMCNVVGPDYPQYTQLSGETSGLFYSITGDFQGIIDRLSTVFSSQYVVSYTTRNPARNNTWRNLIITAERGGKGGWDDGRYFIAGELPTVYGFAAAAVGYDKIYCRWHQPAAAVYDGVRIVRKRGGFPGNVEDGILIYEGRADSVWDGGLTPDTIYYYSAFTYNDSSGQVSGVSAYGQGYARTWPFSSGESGWAAEKSGITSNLYAVVAGDSTHVMVAGDNGAILRSTSAGTTWENHSITLKTIIRDLDFADQITGWLVGQSAAGVGLNMKTGSSGYSWTAWPTTAAKILYANAMVSDEIGWNVGSLGVIEKTINGGATWAAQYNATDKTFYDVDFCNSDTGWVVGDAGVIMKTLDGGATWTSQVSGVASAIRGVTFMDADWGWAVSADGKVLRTIDGGATWSVTMLSDLGLTDIDFVDYCNGVVVGPGGRIYRSVNGGLSWVRIESGVNVQLNAVTLLNPYTGWAVGDAGAILSLGKRGEATYSGMNVAVSSVDADAFPVVKTFVSVVDPVKRTAITDLTADNFKAREDGTLQTPIKVEMISSGSGARADIAFVFDVTGSMGDEISGLKARALSFADALAAKGIDFRLGLVTFSDTIEEVHDFTADAAEFKSWIDGLRASGGGDTKENSLEGLARASKLSFRETSQKMAVLITDAEYHQAGESGGGTTTYTTETMLALLQGQRIVTHVVGPDAAQFHQLADRTSGLWFNITSDFGGIIDAIGAMLTSQYVITYTSSRPTPDNTWRQVAVVAERTGKSGYDIGRYYVGASRIVLAPEAIIGINGASFDVSAEVDGIVNLGLVHFVIAYDAAKVDVESWLAGDFLKQGGASDPLLAVIDDGAGLLDVTTSRVGATSGASGSGTLLAVRFKVLSAECASDLNLNAVNLRQPDNTALPVASRGAHIQAAATAGLLGDLDSDLDIDLRDFTLLSSYWQPVNDARGDIGPASGAVPALTAARDAIVNFEDLFVFTRMWNWYQSRPASGAALGKTSTTLAWRITPAPEAANLYICELYGESLSDLAMAHLRILYNPAQLQVSEISAGGVWAGGDATTALFADHQEQSGVIDLALARLADKTGAAEVAGSGSLLRLRVEELGGAGALCDWKLEALDLRDCRSSRLQAQAPHETAIRFSELPTRFSLSQNYPNPFNGRTEVRFTVPKSGTVRVTILNILGQPVRTLVNERLDPGAYRHIWDGRNETGQEVVSGVYLLRMEAGSYREMRRMAFVK